MPFDLANLLACMRLRETGTDTYEGDNLDLDYRRVFGGQLLAQTVQALRGSAGDKTLKSLTQRFPREGDVALPITYEVNQRQVGRTFATMDVSLTQEGKLISTASATLHLVEEGLGHPATPPDTASPQDCVAEEISMIPWEIRVVDGVNLSDPAPRPPTYRFWMRAADVSTLTSDDSLWVHQALLAHATDLTVIGTALLAVDGLSQADTGTAFHSAVTSHALWFHDSFRMDDWVLVDQKAPALCGGRGFGRGDVWQDGRLVASFAQESMVRLLAQTPSDQ
ncbi:MAG TPA: acyl-CoA thioesterase domain-containing protein [Mycobacteriales bacterium]|nr:acyl-CoA thioesterase domain-containing protein [Mycobacteriales bacterium]